MFLGCFWGVSGMILGCFRDVSGMFLGCLWSVSGVFLGCFQDVSGVFLECFGSVSGVFLGCVRVGLTTQIPGCGSKCRAGGLPHMMLRGIINWCAIAIGAMFAWRVRGSSVHVKNIFLREVALLAACVVGRSP